MQKKEILHKFIILLIKKVKTNKQKENKKNTKAETKQQKCF